MSSASELKLRRWVSGKSRLWSRRSTVGSVRKIYGHQTIARDEFFGTATSGNVTATVAVTEGADATAIASSLVFSGSLSVTEGADVLTATASEVFSGSVSVVEGADLASLSGGLVFSGALAATEGADSFEASGSFNLVFSGTIEAIEGADSLALNSVQVLLGVAEAIEGADIAAFITSQIFVGILGITEGADEAEFSAYAGEQGVTSTMATVEGADALHAVASFRRDPTLHVHKRQEDYGFRL